jgi:hypothetical protein
MVELLLGDTLYFYVQTTDFPTGNAYAAASAPVFRVYGGNNATPVATGTMSALDSGNTTGFYVGEIALTTANGFVDDACYAVHVAATVDSVTAQAIAETFILRGAGFSDIATAVWSFPDGGPMVGIQSTKGTMFDQLYRALTNKIVANGSTFTLYMDDGVTPMLSGGMGMGPSYIGPLTT